MDFNNMDFLKKNFANFNEQLKQSKEKLDTITIEGQSGAGMVKIKMNGNMDIKELFIDKEIINPQENEILQDLIKAAHADALEKLKSQTTDILGRGLF